jgi:hypothetical protein
MSKAFDKMDRGKLVLNLRRMEVHTALIKLVKDFLNERTQSVCISSTIGSPKPVLNGTTQGTLLGPLFWLMYVDDLETP